ncbi:hypothetical protein CUU52_20835 [Pectobacterium polaris]|nr:hypothetical protein [Pectobacterium polaris]
MHYISGCGIKPHGRPNPPSATNLEGCLLEASSFMTGMPITVTVEWGRLMIGTEINLSHYT